MKVGAIVTGVIGLVILAAMLPVAVVEMTKSSGNFTGFGGTLWALGIAFVGLIGLFTVLKMLGIGIGGGRD